MASSESPLLSVEDVSKHFGGLVALDGVDFRIFEDELVGLIGPNGAGKSTLINVISSIHEPTAGTIRFHGEDITDTPLHAITRKGAVRTFQEAKDFTDVDGERNIRAAQIGNSVATKRTFFAPLFGEPDERRQQREDVIERVGISAETLEKSPEDMTHFERTKLSIARALVNDPVLLMLDEPFAGLTPEETEAMAELVQDIQAASNAVLVIDHDVGTVAQIADRVALLDQGEIIVDGDSEAVLSDERTQAAYFGE
jgi:branched-chain amino acid transport system ATP-binding protein